jgi:hypothetical protein
MNLAQFIFMQPRDFKNVSMNNHSMNVRIADFNYSYVENEED